MARLHLYRRPAYPVVEGQDPCPDPQEVATRPGVRADQAQPDHARLVQLLQARRGPTHRRRPGAFRLVAADPDVDGAAPLELEGRPPLARHPRWEMAAHHR